MSFAVGVIIKATIILICAGLMSIAWRRASSSARYAVWAVGMLSILALPLASIVLPQWEFAVLPGEAPIVQGNSEFGVRNAEFGVPTVPAQSEIRIPLSVVAENAKPAPTPSWQEWLTFVWALGAILVLARLILGTLAVRRLARHSYPLVNADWNELVAQLAVQLGIRTGVRLLISEASVPPMTWGIFRHVILLPSTALDWSADRRKVVLAHEMAHVKRNDGIMQFLSQIVCSVYWFNPLTWYAERRLRIEREKACDDHVLNLGATADDYAGHLLEIARSIRRSRHLSMATVSMAHPSQLETRLRAILDGGIRRYALSRLAATSLILVIAVLTFFVSAVQLTAMATMLIPPAMVPPPPPMNPIATLMQSLASDQSQHASVEGNVVKLGTGEPLAGTTVELYRVIDGIEDGMATPSVMTTGIDGKFAFQRIVPGEYRLVALRTDGFTGAEYGQRSINAAGTPLVLAAGQAVTAVRLTLAPTGSISGRVLDGDGEPLGRVRVHAMRTVYREGTRSLMIVQAVQTNDLGEYRLFWLPPGKYYISAMPEDPKNRATSVVNPPNTANLYALSSSPRVVRSTLDDGRIQEEIYIQTYYPATPNMAEAAPIDLRAGEGLGRIDLTVSPPIPTRHVRGRVINGRTGQPAVNGSVSVMPPSLSPNPTMLSVKTDGKGAFDFSSLIPGDYYISATVGDPFGTDTLTTVGLVTVSDIDLENLTLTVKPEFDIPVNVTIEGQALGENGLTLQLLRGSLAAPFMMELPQRPGASRPNLLSDGAFGPIVLEGVRPGIYQVVPRSIGGGPNGTKSAYIKSMRFGGIDVLNDGLHIEGPPDGALEILVGTDVGIIEGIVVDEKRDPLANVSAVLIPNPPNRHRTDLYTVVSSDSSGRFKMEGVAPGDYRIFAWEEIERSAWQDAEFIRAYEGRGKPVHVGGRGTQNIQVIAVAPGL